MTIWKYIKGMTKEFEETRRHKDRLFRFRSPKSETAGLEKHDASFGCGPAHSVEQLDARMWPRSLSFCPRMSRGATTKLGTLGNFGAVLCTCDTDYSCWNIYSRYFLSRQNSVTRQVCANSSTACRGRNQTVSYFGENKKLVIPSQDVLYIIHIWQQANKRSHLIILTSTNTLWQKRLNFVLKTINYNQ